jgi:hypothetical protein
MALKLTRQKTDIYLIGQEEYSSLAQLKQLPTTKQVLQRFHHHLHKLSSVRNACHATSDELLLLWERSAIPTSVKWYVIKVEHQKEQIKTI